MLPFRHLGLAEKQAKSQTLSLVLGTSLRVQPSCDLPLANDATLTIVNKQETPHDSRSTVRSFAACDDFMLALMTALGLEVDEPPRIVEGPGSLTATALKKRTKELTQLMRADMHMHADAQAADRVGEASADVWAEVATEDGRVYYHNTETNETAWERPAAALRLPALDGEGLQLPEGWSAHEDPATGVTFFYCAAKSRVDFVHPHFGAMYEESHYEDEPAAASASAAERPAPRFLAELVVASV